MQVTQALKGAIQSKPDCVAVIDRERSRTWSEVGARVARAAAALQGLGVQRGDRVAVLALNSDRYFELLFAISWAGTVIVPLNTRWVAAEVEAALADCCASALIVDDTFADIGAQLKASHPELKCAYIGDGKELSGFLDYESELSACEPIEDMSGEGDDLWGIFYTSGTTGQPKGVMLSQANVFLAALTWIPTMNFSPRTRYLNVAGYFHIAGTQPAIALTMAGGTLICTPKFDPALAMEVIERHRVNYCFFIPTMLNMVLHHPDLARRDLSSVEYCQYAGGPTPEALLNLTMEKLPAWKLIQGYGQTEASGMATSLQWEAHHGEGSACKRLATGLPAYGIEMRIVDADSREVPRRTVGEIAQRGSTVMLGYWGNLQATAAVIHDGWLHTGDAAWMDEDGYIYIVDRLKDMIVSGGENVYSKEVENAVSSHPAVRECAVIGIPHSTWGEAVHAVVVLKDGQEATAESIVAHCRTRIAGYKCPRSVEFRKELPLSPTGKVVKPILREPYWAGHARRVN
jgi:long-chain acyl-CoA synthetase